MHGRMTTLPVRCIPDGFGLDEAVPPHGALYIQRNKDWLGKLTAYLKTDRTYFVVVGTGHLVGEDGLVDLLRGRGRTVRRIRK